MKHRRRYRGPVPVAVVGVIAVSVAGAVAWHASDAAFSGTTGNGGNAWSTATVSLADDDSGTAIFSVTGAEPGDTGQNCVTVTYTGTAPATVTSYGTGLTGGLGPYLQVTVEQGTGGSFGTCTGFASQASATGTLASFAATYNSFGTGFGSWSAPTAGTSRTYRISWSLAADNAAANRSVTMTFTWEARNT